MYARNLSWGGLATDAVGSARFVFVVQPVAQANSPGAGIFPPKAARVPTPFRERAGLVRAADRRSDSFFLKRWSGLKTR